MDRRITVAIAAAAAAALIGSVTPVQATVKVYESRANLQIARIVRDVLVERGMTVHMTRDADVTLKPSDRYGLANRLGVDAFISIHNNASTSKKPSGTIVFRSIRKDGSRALGLAIRDRFEEEFGPDRMARIATRRGCCGDYYYQLRRPKMPAVLVEGAFVSNPEEGRALATDPEFRRRIAMSIARGILRFQRTFNPRTARELDPGVVIPLAQVPVVDADARALGRTRVRLTWTSPEGGSEKFRIYRDGILIDHHPGREGRRVGWTDRTAVTGATHSYEVRTYQPVVRDGVRVALEAAAVPVEVTVPSLSVVLDPGHGGRDPGAVRTY